MSIINEALRKAQLLRKSDKEKRTTAPTASQTPEQPKVDKKEKLLQIVLVGQPELDAKLQLPELRQLRQRVAVHFHVQPLGRDDVERYIDHRLNKAFSHTIGSKRLSFTDQAIDSIFHFSKGSPRTINIICDRALLAGFVAETYSINDEIIQNCVKEILYCEHH